MTLEPFAELFHKQQFIKNITCDDLKVQVEFATSMIGEWDLDKIHRYFSSMVAMKRFDASKEKSRSANNVGRKSHGKHKNDKSSRKAHKAQCDTKPTGKNDRKSSGRKPKQIMVPSEQWKTMSESARNEIIASNRAACNAHAASTTTSTNSNNDSENSESYPDASRTS